MDLTPTVLKHLQQVFYSPLGFSGFWYLMGALHEIQHFHLKSWLGAPTQGQQVPVGGTVNGFCLKTAILHRAGSP